MNGPDGSPGQSSDEAIAYLLFNRIIKADDRLSGPRVSRVVLLDLYAECLTAARGDRSNRRPPSVRPHVENIIAPPQILTPERTRAPAPPVPNTVIPQGRRGSLWNWLR